MYTKVKTDKELDALRQSCKIAATVLQHLKKQVAVGITALELDAMARKETKSLGAVPAFLGYEGFPAAICISKNDEVVHGIPNKREYKKGDLISLDFGVNFGGMISDTAITLIVGGSDDARVKQLVSATQQSLIAGIKAVKSGAHIGDIGANVQAVLDANKLGIVRDLVGHGVGHHVHEEPNIPNYGKAGTGDVLKEGMTIAIEPMATLGDYGVRIDADGWTIRTADKSLAAHFEHTVLVTHDGYEILTQV